jgi:conjugative transfer signal peptidase TraF
MSLMNAVNRCLAGTALIAAAGGVGIVLAGLCGLRINDSASMPVGLWVERPAPAQLTRGLIVIWCAPNAGAFHEAHERGYMDDGSCPSGYAPLLKPVAAIPGDTVRVDREGLRVNGVLLAHTQALQKDPRGRALPHLAPGEYRVEPGEIWLVSTCHPGSFDSRYLGALDASRVRGTVVPLWVHILVRFGKSVRPEWALGGTVDCLQVGSH